MDAFHLGATIDMAADCQVMGNKESGWKARVKIKSALGFGYNQTVTLNFAGIARMSSGFAEEAFGKLFFDLGPVKFSAKCRLINISPLVAATIDQAIIQQVRLEPHILLAGAR